MSADRPFCASSPEAAALPDAEFWERVYHQDRGEPDYDFTPLSELFGGVTEFGPANPCPLCGAIGECAVDDEGRPLVHAFTDDDARGSVGYTEQPEK